MECDSRTISIQIKTEKPFFGTIFVKDFASEPICVSRGTGRLSAFLEFEIGLCGALRQRILNPKGTVVRTIITISFHVQTTEVCFRIVHPNISAILRHED